ncbi:MAG: hypothetical protein R6U32_06620 [Candidatus Woesearchaeota archaeon]
MVEVELVQLIGDIIVTSLSGAAGSYYMKKNLKRRMEEDEAAPTIRKGIDASREEISIMGNDPLVEAVWGSLIEKSFEADPPEIRLITLSERYRLSGHSLIIRVLDYDPQEVIAVFDNKLAVYGPYDNIVKQAKPNAIQSRRESYETLWRKAV